MLLPQPAVGGKDIRLIASGFTRLRVVVCVLILGNKNQYGSKGKINLISTNNSDKNPIAARQRLISNRIDQGVHYRF